MHQCYAFAVALITIVLCLFWSYGTKWLVWLPDAKSHADVHVPAGLPFKAQFWCCARDSSADGISQRGHQACCPVHMSTAMDYWYLDSEVELRRCCIIISSAVWPGKLMSASTSILWLRLCVFDWLSYRFSIELQTRYFQVLCHAHNSGNISSQRNGSTCIVSAAEASIVSSHFHVSVI